MSKPTPTPAWLIERLALGELPAAEAEALRARLRAEGRDPEAEVAALASSNRELLASTPPRVAAASIRARLDAAAKPRRARAWMLALPAAGLAAAVLLLAVRQPPLPPYFVDGGDETPKGAPGLAVYRHRADHAERLRQGDHASAGDLLRLQYLRGSGYGVMLSFDGSGNVTMHLPEKGDVAVPLKGSEALKSSFELDDAPGFERFFIVASNKEFSVAQALEAARALARRPDAATARLPLPETFAQTSLRLDKTRKDQP
jgi:hypothetical protein